SRHVSLAAAQRKRTPSTGPKLRSRDPLARFNREIGRRIDVVAIFPRRRLVDPAGLVVCLVIEGCLRYDEVCAFLHPRLLSTTSSDGCWKSCCARTPRRIVMSNALACC